MRAVSLATVMVALAGLTPASANEEVQKLTQDANQWVLQTGDYANTRFSKLDQINAGNVGKLQVAWTFSTGVLRGHEGSPLVIGDTMYVHTPFPNTVYALDLNADGKILWKYEPKQDPNVIPVMCCDTVNRGLAYADGKVFLHQADTTVVALDAKTGKVVWSAVNGDPKKGDTNTATVLPVKDKLIVGISGGEFGVRCHVTAYDLKTGKQVWRAFSVGSDADVLLDPEKTMELGKPVGKDSVLEDLAGRPVEDRRRLHVGLVFLRPDAKRLLLRLGQSRHLEPEAAPGRQQVVDDHLFPRCRHRYGEVGLPDDPPRRVGL